MIQIAAISPAAPAGLMRPALLAAQSGVSDFALALGSLQAPRTALDGAEGDAARAKGVATGRQLFARVGKDLPEPGSDLPDGEHEGVSADALQVNLSDLSKHPAFAWFALPAPPADAAPIPADGTVVSTAIATETPVLCGPNDPEAAVPEVAGKPHTRAPTSAAPTVAAPADATTGTLTSAIAHEGRGPAAPPVAPALARPSRRGSGQVEAVEKPRAAAPRPATGGLRPAIEPPVTSKAEPLPSSAVRRPARPIGKMENALPDARVRGRQAELRKNLPGAPQSLTAEMAHAAIVPALPSPLLARARAEATIQDRTAPVIVAAAAAGCSPQAASELIAPAIVTTAALLRGMIQPPAATPLETHAVDYAVASLPTLGAPVVADDKAGPAPTIFASRLPEGPTFVQAPAATPLDTVAVRPVQAPHMSQPSVPAEGKPGLTAAVSAAQRQGLPAFALSPAASPTHTSLDRIARAPSLPPAMMLAEHKSSFKTTASTAQPPEAPARAQPPAAALPDTGSRDAVRARPVPPAGVRAVDESDSMAAVASAHSPAVSMRAPLPVAAPLDVAPAHAADSAPAISTVLVAIGGASGATASLADPGTVEAPPLVPLSAAVSLDAGFVPATNSAPVPSSPPALADARPIPVATVSVAQKADAPALPPITVPAFAAASALAQSGGLMVFKRMEPRDPEQLSSFTLTPAGAPVIQVAAASDTQQGALDMRRQEWMGKMVEAIEAMRDAAPVRETRIALSPDALGKVNISVRQDGDRVHVHIAAETQAARQILTEAQPRLAEIAETRGIRLGQTTVDQQGTNAQSGQRHNDAPRATIPSAPPRARPESKLTDTDERIA